MNETDIESSVVTSVVVVDNKEATISSIIQSPNIIFKVESNEKSDVIRFFSKQEDDSISDIVFEVESTDEDGTRLC